MSKISLANKSLCTGCHSCYNVCPINCITMASDIEGFLYPEIDTTKCMQCGLCEKTCPAMVQGDTRMPLRVYAAKNTHDDVRNKSSSGGIFISLAEQVIDDGGIVFGARFTNKWDVIHDYTSKIEELVAFRGSKYVQSTIGNTYKQAREFLIKGRMVLYSGTPCQIAGLNFFLQKKYENLLAIDIVCHGVPSSIVWKKYLTETVKTINNTYANDWYKTITNINFRDKSLGWNKYHFSIQSSGHNNIFLELSKNNIFMKGFLHNLYLRPSCYNCQVKPLKSGSDITLGDYWGIEKVVTEFADDRGINLVLINTQKGETAYNNLEKDDRETAYMDALTSNPSLENSARVSLNRNIFFKKFDHVNIIKLINKLTHISLAERIWNKFISNVIA